LILVPKPGKTVAKDAMLAFLSGKIAKWWMPDDVVSVDEIPHTATGKIKKSTLREKFADYRFPTG
jgi:fatty-acyl-CoA synthase